mmetsp:Transcript_37890/g.36310  ORF Transcript_37890/g.36310 Transcript_37890/m.36310 type:complete len:96 (+) Transcript_37890:68-355(+)
MLKRYTIKIIPMLNIDGVILGNTRVSLAGVDLNRRWGKKVLKEHLHPEIFSIKKLIDQDQYSISMYLDLHGHTKQTSIFFYGNSINESDRYLVGR